MATRRHVPQIIAPICIGLTNVLLSGCLSAPHPIDQNTQGLQQVIQTEFATVHGPRESLAAYSGKIVMLHFFASWCSDCAGESQSLRNLHAAFQGTDFQIVGVAIDDDPFTARSFTTKHQLPFPVILDIQGELKRYFSIKNVPTTMFLDRMGVPVTFQDPATGTATAKLSGARRWDTERPVEMIAGMIEAR